MVMFPGGIHSNSRKATQSLIYQSPTNLPINKSEVDEAEDAEITIYVNTLPSESLKKIYWSNFHFS